MSNELERAFQFWINGAHKSSEARELARALGLDLPAGETHGFKSGLRYPIRRLVVTGKDTPENFRILLGVDNVPGIHAETRKEVLMAADIQMGSPSHMMNGFMDEGCPTFSPRPATDAEKVELQKQREFTEKYANLLGNR